MSQSHVNIVVADLERLDECVRALIGWMCGHKPPKKAGKDQWPEKVKKRRFIYLGMDWDGNLIPAHSIKAFRWGDGMILARFLKHKKEPATAMVMDRPLCSQFADELRECFENYGWKVQIRSLEPYSIVSAGWPTWMDLM